MPLKITRFHRHKHLSSVSHTVPINKNNYIGLMYKLNKQGKHLIFLTKYLKCIYILIAKYFVCIFVSVKNFKHL